MLAFTFEHDLTPSRDCLYSRSTKCKTGFYVAAKTCKQCGISGCANCATTEGKLTCTEVRQRVLGAYCPLIACRRLAALWRSHSALAAAVAPFH